MSLRIAKPEEFDQVQEFYWNLIDAMRGRADTPKWEKGVYPADEFISDSIDREELFLMDGEDGPLASVVLNSSWNEGYDVIKWGVECSRDEVIVPHILAVNPNAHRIGVGKKVVKDIIDFARSSGKKTIRLDVLSGNIAAEHLYTSMGFRYVISKDMYYEDTGWMEFILYEYLL